MDKKGLNEEELALMENQERMFSLSAEEKQRKAALEALHKCDIHVMSVPLDKEGNRRQTVFLKDPSIELLDAYLAMQSHHPVIARQNLFGGMLCASQEEKAELLANKAVVMGMFHVIDDLTMTAIATVKKN